MGMGFAPTWFRQVSPPPLLHKTTFTTVEIYIIIVTSQHGYAATWRPAVSTVHWRRRKINEKLKKTELKYLERSLDNAGDICRWQCARRIIVEAIRQAGNWPFSHCIIQQTPQYHSPATSFYRSTAAAARLYIQRHIVLPSRSVCPMPGLCINIVSSCGLNK